MGNNIPETINSTPWYPEISNQRMDAIGKKLPDMSPITCNLITHASKTITPVCDVIIIVY